MILKPSFILIIAALTLNATIASGAMVDTVSVYSQSMQKETRCVVILPSNAEQTNLPVLYLLHGLGGDHRSWLKVKPELPAMAEETQMIIVCPNGGVRSWYIDSPIDTTFRYETYMIHELIPFIDNHYSTISNRSGRAIAGLSMGGHGSLFLSIRHPELFGAACSTSGSVDLLKKTFSWKYKEQILGDTVCCMQNWINHSVTQMANRFVTANIALHLDCGTEDDLYIPNKRLHEKWDALGVRHVYIEQKGKHDATYWNTSIDPIMRFVDRFFDKK
ncbi:MAG: alpha/beta hydrolase [Flavobacteriales bacterium]